MTTNCFDCGVSVGRKELLCPDCFVSRRAFRELMPDERRLLRPSLQRVVEQPCLVCGQTAWATNRYGDIWCSHCWCASAATLEE